MLSPTEVRGQLKPHIDGNDELLVIDVTRDAAAWAPFTSSGSEWLLNNL